MLCYVMLCYVMLCYAMLCYAMLCYVMLCFHSFNMYVMCELSFKMFNFDLFDDGPFLKFENGLIGF